MHSSTVCKEVSVSLGHSEVKEAVMEQLCPKDPKDPKHSDNCAQIFAQTYKPLDIRRMVDWIENKYGPIPIAVGGHSGGAKSTMTVAGTKRYVDNTIPILVEGLEDARPDAFIALSPTGPNYSGYFGTDFLKPATSWDSVTRPMLTATGDGDNKCDNTPDCLDAKLPWNRQAPHAFMPGVADGAGPKVQLYIRDASTFHTIFRLSDSKCAPNGRVSQAKCADITRHLKSVVIAFLDENLRSVSKARHYLSSDDIQKASMKLNVTLSRK